MVEHVSRRQLLHGMTAGASLLALPRPAAEVDGHVDGVASDGVNVPAAAGRLRPGRLRPDRHLVWRAHAARLVRGPFLGNGFPDFPTPARPLASADPAAANRVAAAHLRNVPGKA